MSSLKIFPNLPLDKQKAITMRAEGATFEAIAAQLGTHRRTIENWLLPEGSLIPALHEYQKNLADRQLAAVEDLQAIAQRDAIAAWDHLKEIAFDERVPKRVALNALDSMLDRAGMARLSKNESKNETQFKPMPPAEKEEFMREALRLVVPKTSNSK